jgi:hypothetical protein
MEWKARLNAVVSQSGTKLQSFRRNLKDCVLRFAGIVSTLKSTCTTFGVRMEWKDRLSASVSLSGTK